MQGTEPIVIDMMGLEKPGQITSASDSYTPDPRQLRRYHARGEQFTDSWKYATVTQITNSPLDALLVDRRLLAQPSNIPVKAVDPTAYQQNTKHQHGVLVYLFGRLLVDKNHGYFHKEQRASQEATLSISESKVWIHTSIAVKVVLDHMFPPSSIQAAPAIVRVNILLVVQEVYSSLKYE